MRAQIQSKIIDEGEAEKLSKYEVRFRQPGTASAHHKVTVSARDDEHAKKLGKKEIQNFGAGWRYIEHKKLDEESVDETSKDKLARYVDKATKSYAKLQGPNRIVPLGTPLVRDDPKTERTRLKRAKGIGDALKKLDELGLPMNPLSRVYPDENPNILYVERKTSKKPGSFSHKAVKSEPPPKKSVKEETVDEITKATLGRYVNKARRSMTKAYNSSMDPELDISTARGTNDLEAADRIWNKRKDGIAAAKRRLKESTELSELSLRVLDDYVKKTPTGKWSDKARARLASQGFYKFQNNLPKRSMARFRRRTDPA